MNQLFPPLHFPSAKEASPALVVSPAFQDFVASFAMPAQVQFRRLFPENLFRNDPFAGLPPTLAGFRHRIEGRLAV